MKIETKDGRLFVFEGEEPYRRVDGSMTFLRLWSSSCVKCSDLFVVKTPSTVSELGHSNSFSALHCQEHKLTADEVTALRVSARAKSMAIKKKAGKK